VVAISMLDFLHVFFLALLVVLVTFTLLKCSLTVARRKWPVQLQSTTWDWVVQILAVLAAAIAT
jgi:hypothetical protein